MDQRTTKFAGALTSLNINSPVVAKTKIGYKFLAYIVLITITEVCNIKTLKSEAAIKKSFEKFSF